MPQFAVARAKRRAFLLAAGGIALAHALPAAGAAGLDRAGAMAAWRERIRSFLARGVIPILDPEATYNSWINLAWLRDQMDQLGVSQICFAPHAQLGSEQSLRLHRDYPGYFVPTTMDASSPEWYQNTARFTEQTRRDLASGNYFLMGEFEVRHYQTGLQLNQPHRDVAIPIDSPAMQRVFELAEQTGYAFMLHYEIEDALLPPLEAMLARHPKAKVIWCHLGQIRYPDRSTVYGPPYVRSLIERFPALHFDFGHTGPANTHPLSGRRDQTLYRFTGTPPWSGVLDADWQQVIEDHAERFLASSDIDAQRYREFTRKITRFRELFLGRFSERTRHLVTYQNAWRLITGEAWS